MLEAITSAVLFVSAVTATASQVAPVAAQLPARPSQEQISCHDDSWRESTLTSITVGKQLDEKLAPFVEKALTDASTAGYRLVINSGYRSCDEQQRLRIAACGLGDYNLHKKPIDLCLPPTEPAGKSLHNEGLAVDFACSGYGLFESSPCYIWLKANARTYHLYEHRLEPWHWSTTGA